MTSTSKPLLTRRRVIAAAVLLVLVIAVAGFVFGVFDGSPATQVTATFVDFEKSEDGTNTLAIILLTNGAARRLWVHEVNNPSLLIFYKFLSLSPTGEVTWTVPGKRGLQLVLEPFYAFPCKVQLPTDGRTGRIAVFCEMLPKELPVILDQARDLMWNVYTPQLKPVWAVCGQEIQCPLVRSDGTVEPARLVPKGEGKAP